jgi:large subunit ribosomal protein L10
MSKATKQMQMEVLTDTFKDVKDLVVMSVKGLTCHADYTLRATLRKKNIRVQMVKNTITRKVFGEVGMNIDRASPYWQGPTMVAWGAGSIAEISRAVDEELKNVKTAAIYKDKVVIKGAIAEGQAVTFEQALKMPTRAEAIGSLLGLILSPGAMVSGCLVSPGGQVAGQVQTISEKKEEGADAPETVTPA